MNIPKMLNHYTRLPNSIYILFFARMVNSMGAGFALGPLISGDYIKRYGINNIWPAIFFLGIVAAALMYLLYFSEKKRKNVI